MWLAPGNIALGTLIRMWIATVSFPSFCISFAHCAYAPAMCALSNHECEVRTQLLCNTDEHDQNECSPNHLRGTEPIHASDELLPQCYCRFHNNPHSEQLKNGSEKGIRRIREATVANVPQASNGDGKSAYLKAESSPLHVRQQELLNRQHSTGSEIVTRRIHTHIGCIRKLLGGYN